MSDDDLLEVPEFLRKQAPQPRPTQGTAREVGGLKLAECLSWSDAAGKNLMAIVMETLSAAGYAVVKVVPETHGRCTTTPANSEPTP